MPPITSPFARIMGTMPPLIPKPEALGPEPGPVATDGLAAATSDTMPLPAFPSSGTMPKVVKQPFDPLTASPEELATHPLTSRLRSDEAKDLHPWGTPENHPGFLGKFGHALSVITGGPNRRQYEEMGLQKSLQDLLASQSNTALQGAEKKNFESEITHRNDPSYQPLATSGGYENYNPKTGEITPTSGQPVMPYVKPGNAQHVNLMGPDGKPMLGFVDPVTKITTDASGKVIENPIPFEKEGNPPHITVMHDGKPHVMGMNPATKQYDQDLGVAPPNYAMMAGTFRMAPAVLDTQNGNAPAIMTVDQLNAANAAQPGRFIPAGAGVPALGKKALIEDIRGNINSVRDVLQNPHMPPFTADQRAKLALTMGRGDRGAIDAMVTGEFMNSLSPEQQDYVIHLSQLVENAMAMRSVLGAGQGSEDLRDAIRRTIPSAANPSPEYSLKQLAAFEQVLNRLERGVPNVKLGGDQSGPWSAPEGAPAVPKEDGRFLYADGKAVAKSQGGKWVQP